MDRTLAEFLLNEDKFCLTGLGWRSGVLGRSSEQKGREVGEDRWWRWRSSKSVGRRVSIVASMERYELPIGNVMALFCQVGGYPLQKGMKLEADFYEHSLVFYWTLLCCLQFCIFGANHPRGLSDIRWLGSDVFRRTHQVQPLHQWPLFTIPIYASDELVLITPIHD